MKIDLHCHTKKTKSGDPDTRNVTSELFCQKIMDAVIKIAAITNHNHFDFISSGVSRSFTVSFTYKISDKKKQSI